MIRQVVLRPVSSVRERTPLFLFVSSASAVVKGCLAPEQTRRERLPGTRTGPPPPGRAVSSAALSWTLPDTSIRFRSVRRTRIDSTCGEMPSVISITDECGERTKIISRARDSACETAGDGRIALAIQGVAQIFDGSGADLARPLRCGVRSGGVRRLDWPRRDRCSDWPRCTIWPRSAHCGAARFRRGKAGRAGRRLQPHTLGATGAAR